MTQDYIKRGNPKSNNRGKAKSPKAGRKTNAKPAPQSAAIQGRPPYIAMATMLLTVGVFGYFLWSINGAADHQSNNPVTSNPLVSATADKTTAVPSSKKTTTTTEDQLPPPPKEDWQYIDELKKKTVEVKVNEVKNEGPFLMQCATFKDARRAEAFKAQLALLSFESRIKTTQNSSGTTHHRVQLGPYETRRDALQAKHKLSRHKINGCKIWLWS